MPKFAKLFGTDDDQVLVKLDESPAGGPEIRLYFQPPGLGVGSVALRYTDDEAGWALAEKTFERMDEAEARRGVDAALREMGLAAQV